jgi:hypothetical protein
MTARAWADDSRASKKGHIAKEPLRADPARHITDRQNPVRVTDGARDPPLGDPAIGWS